MQVAQPPPTPTQLAAGEGASKERPEGRRPIGPGPCTLHVYGQSAGHDPAFLVGTTEQIERLRDALTQALEKGYARPVFCTKDGEDYVVHVVVASPDVMDTVALPHDDATAGSSPYELVPERCESCNRVFNGEGELDTRCDICRRRLDLEPR